MKRTISILTLILALSFTLTAQTQNAKPVKAESLSSKQIMALISTAKTPVEHQRIATFYQAKANQLISESQEHAQMAEAYKQNPITSSSKFAKGTIDHCLYISKSLKDSAVKLQELAQIHEQMAKEAEAQ